MIVVRGVQQLDPQKLHHTVVTIGNFDGVHLGHQHIISTAREKAVAAGGVCVAFTFRPHPQVALRPGAQLPLLSSYDEKLALLERAGVDLTIEEPFSREFSTTPPEQFFSDVIVKRLNAEAVVVGYDFAFGKERSGHLDALAEFCKRAGIELEVVPPQRVGEEVVSSSKIRQHLLAGEVDQAGRLLGRFFSYRGIVVKGDGRGRKIGFPTANLKLDDKLALPYGVYASWAELKGQKFPSVTNVGVRPTFQKGEELLALIETHLIGNSSDLYGETLDVQFVKRLRAEKKFSGVEELKKQIALDVIEARQILVGPLSD